MQRPGPSFKMDRHPAVASIAGKKGIAAAPDRVRQNEAWIGEDFAAWLRCT